MPTSWPPTFINGPPSISAVTAVSISMISENQGLPASSLLCPGFEMTPKLTGAALVMGERPPMAAAYSPWRSTSLDAWRMTVTSKGGVTFNKAAADSLSLATISASALAEESNVTVRSAPSKMIWSLVNT